MRAVHLAICASATFALSGCVRWTTRGSDGSSTRHYLGYTQVRVPSMATIGEAPQISHVKTTGISLGREGLLIGAQNSFLIGAPLHEQGFLYFNVQTEEDMRRILGFIRDHEFLHAPLCITTNAFGAPP